MDLKDTWIVYTSMGDCWIFWRTLHQRMCHLVEGMKLLGSRETIKMSTTSVDPLLLLSLVHRILCVLLSVGINEDS